MEQRLDHATFRELKGVEDSLQKRMSAIELEQASQRAALMHLPEDMRELTSAVNAMAARLPAQQQQPDQLALGIHRLAEAVAKQQQPTPIAEVAQLLRTSQPGGAKTWALVGALGFAASLMAWQLFIG